MTSRVDEAITEVNSVLDSNWSKDQVKKGKFIYCDPDWVPIAGTVLDQYRRAGWDVKMRAEITPFGREFSFHFTYPKESSGG